MPKDGWIKLWRSSLDSEVFKDEVMWRLWCLCLLKATYKDYDQMVGLQVVSLKPGQFVTGRFALHYDYYKNWKPRKEKGIVSKPLSENSIWNRMVTLQKLNNVEIKTTNKYSIISIVNWEKYQGELEDVENKLSDRCEEAEKKLSQTRSKEEEELLLPEPLKDENQKEIKKVEKVEEELSESFIHIPLIKRDGSYIVRMDEVKELQEIYPGIDVKVELKKCRRWNDKNVAKRKTSRGIHKHLTWWMDSAQNKSRGQGPGMKSEKDRYSSGECVRCGGEFDKLEDGFCEECLWKYPK